MELYFSEKPSSLSKLGREPDLQGAENQPDTGCLPGQAARGREDAAKVMEEGHGVSRIQNWHLVGSQSKHGTRSRPQCERALLVIQGHLPLPPKPVWEPQPPCQPNLPRELWGHQQAAEPDEGGRHNVPLALL